MEWSPLIVGIVAAISGLLGAVVTAVYPKKGSTENMLIDQLQQENEKRDERLDVLEGVVSELRRESRVKDDYIATLRVHISDGKGPPPPEWPIELRTRSK